MRHSHNESKCKKHIPKPKGMILIATTNSKRPYNYKYVFQMINLKSKSK